ncbi:hypothetical protein KSE_03450 [Kitasatospora setae KM-6054]|uniref:Uncharacterized protein n=1 Tax=Kitasatospora setae (strain ATCC 33774 / DSM 43861 / JCM 3304 / KCC A-0304 / NBRC 14216 / KM-6054) TaxID=452652 RepID=E4N4R1_KITSK|nr:hypothetical protein KSE_03450 [Kitasatospora setae KM-6054]
MLYRTPDRWRFSIFFAGQVGIACGGLAGVAPTAGPAVAQDACHRLAEETAGRPLTVDWSASERPDRWYGDVTAAPQG